MNGRRSGVSDRIENDKLSCTSTEGVDSSASLCSNLGTASDSLYPDTTALSFDSSTNTVCVCVCVCGGSDVFFGVG